MDIEQVRDFTLSINGVTEDQPFGDDIITYRIEWAETGQCNHNPVAIVNGKKGTNAIVIKAKAGQTVKLDASKSYDPDGDKLTFSWMQQKGIGKAEVEVNEITSNHSAVEIQIPDTAHNDEIHIICEIHDNSHYRLPAYRRIIIKI